MKKRGGYREDFKTRFGLGLNLPEKVPGKKRVWLQAVSLGEMLAMEPLIQALAAQGDKEIFLTTTTSTGYASAVSKYREKTVGIAYFPLDFWPITRRSWRAVKPDLAIVAETELWPEFLQQAGNARVPVVMVNGRLSDNSFGNTKKLAFLFSNQLGALKRVLAGSEMDAERFVKIGIPQDRVSATGNLKMDVAIEPILSQSEKINLKRTLGFEEKFVLLGSSTWPGEEAMLLRAFRKIHKQMPCSLLIVPRHAERRKELKSLMGEAADDFQVCFKSEGLFEGAVDILVADTHGELRTLTQIADLAFIGKSLSPHREGQTPVECGGLGVPMVFGPGMRNFRSIRDQLLSCGAAMEVADRTEAIDALVKLSEDPDRRSEMSLVGQEWHRASKGAVDRTMAALDEILLSVN
ncbi:hypothetical protein MLD52_20815 [Puniceicoccaceae bacterium K14]|nr:hypothetical protein [Puniceicoccaceae bacterium K14]